MVEDRILLNNPEKKINEKVIILILCTITTSKYLTETLMEFQWEIDKPTIILGNFITNLHKETMIKERT